MGNTLTIHDGTVFGERTSTLLLNELTEKMTVRELIRARIYQEVNEYNQRLPDLFQGLIQPTESEQKLNGFRLKKAKPIHWEVQYEKACEAFETNGFFILIDDRQAEHLDEEFVVRVDTDVVFVKLVQLVGG